MKKTLVFIVALLSASFLFAQDFAKLDPSPMDAVYYPKKTVKRFMESNPEKSAALSPKIKIVYSRPQKKGRKIFGKLVPYGKLWRTGANEIPELTLYTDAEIGGKTLPAGKYGIAVNPTEKEWTLYVNSDTDTWGVYSFDEEKNVAEVTATPTKSKKEIDAFSIALEEKNPNLVHLIMGWDDTVVEFPITLK